MKETSSSKKIAKKARQYYRRELKAYTEQTAAELGRLLGNNLKPKPKWIPTQIWMKLLSFFVKINR